MFYTSPHPEIHPIPSIYSTTVLHLSLMCFSPPFTAGGCIILPCLSICVLVYSCIQFLKMLSSTLSPVPILQLPLRESAHWQCLALTSGRLLCGSATNWETSSVVPPINFHRSFHPLIPGKLCSSNLTCFSIDQYLTGLDPLLESPDCSYSLVQFAWSKLGLTSEKWDVAGTILRLPASVDLVVFTLGYLPVEFVCLFVDYQQWSEPRSWDCSRRRAHSVLSCSPCPPQLLQTHTWQASTVQQSCMTNIFLAEVQI